MQWKTGNKNLRLDPEFRKNLTIFLVLAIFMALMPIGSEPHLWQKLNLLFHGWLHGGMDWFDLILHGGPLLGAIGYGIYGLLRKRQ
ncbi:MAG: hypothetical protein KDK37_13945 [Leptospiraceae bacterium]|nr:hypothetical protein [Leptospiraceae bacterium]MCB1305384.1 hypothetical protein [Leptospiraceae bacterium]